MTTAIIKAPTAALDRLLASAHEIIDSLDTQEFARAAAMLLEVSKQSPVDHPIQVIGLKWLAKIARCEGNYVLARKRLEQALEIALRVFRAEDAQTMRLYEKLSLVTRCEICRFGQPGLSQDEKIRAAVQTLYSTPIKTAEADGQTVTALLLKGDCAFFLEQWALACEHYQEAKRLLQNDPTNSNSSRLPERIMEARLSRSFELEPESEY